MAKSRTLNEIRQSKEYQIAKHNADLQAEVAKNIALEEQIRKVKENRTHPCSESTAKAIAEHQLQHKSEGKYEDCTGDVKTHAKVDLEELKGENFYRNPFSHADVDKTVNNIVEKLDGNIYDLIFQAVCDEMNNHYVFDSTEYLTEAGLELFEDEWFEFYHENHGKIINKLIQKLK